MQRRSCLLGKDSQPKPILSFAAGFALHRMVGNDIQVAAMTYRETRKPGVASLRLFCGTQDVNGAKPETLRQTITREFTAEAGDVEKGDLLYELQKPVLVAICPDDRQRETSLHAKVFFSALYQSGSLRQRELIDNSETEREEHLGVPQWFEASELYDHMVKGGYRTGFIPSPRIHPGTVCNLIHRLCENGGKAIQMQYAEFCALNPAVPIDSAEWKHIASYLGGLEAAQS